MGMFSSLFGSAGSDKADKMRQMAIDAFNAIQTPELKDLQVQLDKYVQAGTLTPEQAEAQLLQSNAFNDIVTDPALAGAQKQALAALQEVGTSGGMTAIDKARLQDITNEQNQVAKGRNEAVMQQAQQRGMGGSDINTVNQLLNEQGAADRASQRGTDVAAEAQARALQALQAAGTTAGQIRGQDYGEQSNKAQAENAIDLFNKQTMNQTNLYNVDAANKAQAANLANAQAVANANTGTANTEKTYNAQQAQQVFNDNMAKAQGIAGTYNGWANDATAASRSENAADMALTGGAIQGIATAFGGPAGAAATSPAAKGTTSSSPQFGQVYSPTDKEMGFAEGGEVTMGEDDFKKEHDRLLNTLDNPTPSALSSEADRQRKEMEEQNLNCGGPVKHMAEGGEVKTPPLPITSEGNEGWTIRNPKGQVIGTFNSYAEAADFAQKVQQKQPTVSDFQKGGPVHGHARVSGNSPANDTVKAKLSPGELVVPRTAMSDDQEFDAFMEKFRPSRREKPRDPNQPLVAEALSNLHSRVNRLEGR